MENNKYLLVEKVMRLFGIYFLLLGVGIFVGQFVPTAVVLPISILIIILLIVTAFVKFNRRGAVLFYCFVSFLLGVALYSAIAHYVGNLGIFVVISVFGVSAVLFGIIGLIGFKIKRDLSGWGTYLFVALLALVLFSIVTLFIPLPSIGVVILSGVGIVLFSLYTLYEMNLIAKGYISSEEVPSIAFSLFLNYINIVMDLLRLVGISFTDD